MAIFTCAYNFFIPYSEGVPKDYERKGFTMTKQNSTSKSAMEIAKERENRKPSQKIREDKRTAFRVDCHSGSWSRSAARDPLDILMSRG